MPQLPQYNSQRQINTQSARQPAVLKSGSSDVYDAASQALEKTTEIATKWSNALDTIQFTTAKANYESKVLDIETRALNDPSYNNSDQYLKELEKAKTENLKGFQSKGVESRLALEFDSGNQISKIKIDNIYKKKQIEVGKVSLLAGLDTLLQKKLNATSPVEANKVNTDITNLLNLNVQSGIISPEDAAKKMKDLKKTSVEYDIYNDQSTQEKDSLVLAELKKGEKGQYPDLAPDERLDLIKASQGRIYQNNQTLGTQVKDSQAQRQDNFIDKLVSGTVTLKDIDNEMAIPEDQGGMRRESLLSYQKTIRGGITTDLKRMLDEKDADNMPTARAEKVKMYNKLIEDFIDDKTDIWAARKQLAKAYSDGIIDPKEQQFLNNLRKNLNNIDSNRSSWPAFNNLRMFINKMKGYTATDEEIAINLKSLLGTGDVSEQSVIKTLGDHVKSKIPGVATFPKEGQIFFDKDGNQFTIYPDGSIK